MSRSIAFECFGNRVTLQIGPEMYDEVNELARKVQRAISQPFELRLEQSCWSGVRVLSRLAKEHGSATRGRSPSRVIVDYRKFSTSIRSLSSRF